MTASLTLIYETKISLKRGKPRSGTRFQRRKTQKRRAYDLFQQHRKRKERKKYSDQGAKGRPNAFQYQEKENAVRITSGEQTNRNYVRRSETESKVKRKANLTEHTEDY